MLLGEQDLNGRNCYRVASTSPQGKRILWIDAENYLLRRMELPIEGERGIGYILRPGFDLPPLMFTAEETEAVVLGMALIERTGDTDLKKASERVVAKIAAAVPAPLREALTSRALHAWGASTPAPEGIDFGIVRRAIRDEEKLDKELKRIVRQSAQNEIGKKPEVTIVVSRLS